MAEIVFLCEKCGISIEANDSLCGGNVVCPNCQQEVKVPAPLLQVGLDLNGFILVKVLGIGGMGQVWLAHQTAMNRRIALKILDPGLSKNTEFIERFLREAKNLAKLAHDNVVSVIDAGYSRGIYYMAVNFVDGYELGQKLDEVKVIPEKQALEIMLGIAEGLCFAWNKHRIIHRDIKPANIMIDSEGVPKLMDLGISKCLGEDKSLTMTGIVIGTPYYISPEQGRGMKELDFRCDIYSLGATLYHVVTGEVPYNGPTTISIITQHITEPFPPPRLKNPDVSEQCAVLLEIMMAKKPEQRQQSWEQVISDMRNVLEGKFPETKRPGTGESEVPKSVKAHQKTIDKKISSKAADGVPAQRQVPVKSSSPAKMMLVVVLVLAVIALSVVITVIIVSSTKQTEPQKTVHLQNPTPVEQAAVPVQQENPVEKVVTPPVEPQKKIEPRIETEPPVKQTVTEKHPEPERTPEVVSVPDNSTPKLPMAVPEEVPVNVKDDAIKQEPVQEQKEPAPNSATDNLKAALKKANPSFDEDAAKMQIGENGIWKIDLGGQQINNVSALASLPISFLNLSRTGVSDVGSLKNSKLSELYLDWTNVSDISPLKGLPLKTLSLCGLQVKDFSPLKDMPLESLNLGETNVRDIGFLKGKQLKILSVRRTDVSDLGPLKGMKLLHLSLFETSFKSLKPIEDIDLESIVVSGRMVNQDMYKTFKKMKSLKFISPGPDIKMPAEEFFRRFSWAEKGQQPMGPDQGPKSGIRTGPIR